MLKKLRETAVRILCDYLDDLLLIAGGVCLTAAAACVGKVPALCVAGVCLITYGRLVARAMMGRWRK